MTDSHTKDVSKKDSLTRKPRASFFDWAAIQPIPDINNKAPPVNT